MRYARSRARADDEHTQLGIFDWQGYAPVQRLQPGHQLLAGAHSIAVTV